MDGECQAQQLRDERPTLCVVAQDSEAARRDAPPAVGPQRDLIPVHVVPVHVLDPVPVATKSGPQESGIGYRGYLIDVLHRIEK